MLDIQYDITYLKRVKMKICHFLEKPDFFGFTAGCFWSPTWYLASEYVLFSPTNSIFIIFVPSDCGLLTKVRLEDWFDQGKGDEYCHIFAEDRHFTKM